MNHICCQISGLKRAVIIAYCIAIVAACLFVPWKGDLQATRSALGYSPIWERPEDATFQNFVVVDFERALLEIVGITALGGAVFILADSLERYLATAKAKRKSPKT